MHSPRSPSLNRKSPFHNSLLHSEHFDSRRIEKTNKSRDTDVVMFVSSFSDTQILVTVAMNCTEAGARLQARNFSISLTVLMSYCPAPGWRNWQTQRTQNPPSFTPPPGSTPPPGTIVSSSSFHVEVLRASRSADGEILSSVEKSPASPFGTLGAGSPGSPAPIVDPFLLKTTPVPLRNRRFQRQNISNREELFQGHSILSSGSLAVSPG